MPGPTVQHYALAGPLPERIIEVRAGLSGGAGRSWSNPLRIVANVERSGSSRPNKAKISLWNLSRESIRFLEKPGTTIQLLAGEGVPGMLFRGDLRGRDDVRSTPKPEGLETVIAPQDGRRVWISSYISRSWPPGTDRRILLREAFAALGYSVGYLSPSLPERVYATAYTWVGRAADMVDDLLLGDGASWTHQGGIASITMPSETIPGNVPVIGPDTGLIGSPTRKGKNVKFSTLFNPLIRPKGGVQLEAYDAKGLFRVEKCRDSLDNRGTTWKTDVDAVRPRR